MPNCFTLTPKGGNTPVTFVSVDAAMCQHLGKQVDPVKWYREWYNIEGLALACGKDWNWMRENFPDRLEVIDFLEANYISNAWAMR